MAFGIIFGIVYVAFTQALFLVLSAKLAVLPFPLQLEMLASWD